MLYVLSFILCVWIVFKGKIFFNENFLSILVVNILLKVGDLWNCI